MARSAEEIIAEAIELSPENRALIAETLLDSLDLEDDFPISDAWKEEIRRRCAQIDAGEDVLVDGDEAMEELRDRFD
ncbi:addiction module protein [Endothiovibrio diazotrophicus]